MTVATFAQLLLNGVAMGMIYALVASGLILLIGIVRILNFAHGEFYMVGAYTTFIICQVFHIDYFVSIVVAISVVTLLALLSYTLVFRHIRGDVLLCTAASIGLSMIIQRGALISFGTEERGLPSPFRGTVTIGKVALPLEKLAVILLCLVVMLGFYFLLKKTKTGKAMRALKLDAEAATLQGINTNWIYLITFAMGCALAGLAGGFVAPVLSITNDMGHTLLLNCLLAMTLGGMESMIGGILGGFVIGVILSFGGYFLSGLSEIILFCIIAVILIFKPGGLFGHAAEHI